MRFKQPSPNLRSYGDTQEPRNKVEKEDRKKRLSIIKRHNEWLLAGETTNDEDNQLDSL